MSKKPGVLFPKLVKVRNARAVERTIAELRRSDRLDPADAAFLAAIRSTAEALDAAPNSYIAATVARVHLVGLQLLLGRPAAAAPDELDAFVASLRSPTLGDTPHP